MGKLGDRDSMELEKAIALLKEYGAREVYLFGSMARGDIDEHSDWDFAVRGIPAERYYTALAKLLMSMTRQVDLVDLDEANPLAYHIQAKAEFTRVA
jgi:predicted nucleotidyltransferase